MPTNRTVVVDVLVWILRSSLAVVFGEGIRRRNPGAVVNAIVAILVTFLPEAIERRYAVRLRPWQRVYTVTAAVTHAVGMLGPYEDVPWWDHVTHVHSATILGGFAFAAARRHESDPRLAVSATVFVGGVLWELLEYVIHVIARRFDVEPILISYGPRDTALDLGFNFVGGTVVLAFGDRVLRNVTGETPR